MRSRSTIHNQPSTEAEARRLRAIYRDLARTIGWEKRPQEVTTVVGVVAMALLVASVVLRFRVAPLQ